MIVYLTQKYGWLVVRPTCKYIPQVCGRESYRSVELAMTSGVELGWQH